MGFQHTYHLPVWWIACALLTAGCTPEQQATEAALPLTETLTPEALFADRCAGCHQGTQRAAALPALATLGPAQISFALTNGSMQAQADGLSAGQIMELSEFIAGNAEPYVPDSASFCATATVDATPRVAHWGLSAGNTAAVSLETTSITTANAASLTLAWAFGLPDVASARSQPVVTEDTLFVAATSGHLFALNRESGCIRWHSQVPAPPRTALTLGTSGGAPVLFYGDMEAHVNAIDAFSGQRRWRVPVEVSEHSMLTGAQQQFDHRLIVPVSQYEVALAADPAYECCRSRGAVLALHADTGELLWVTHMTPPAEPTTLSEVGTRQWGPSGVSVWSTPTIDRQRGLIYVGTGQNASQPATRLSDSVVALDADTGAITWHFQAVAGDAWNMACDQRPTAGPNCPKWRGPDHDFGAAVIITQDHKGNDRLIAGQKSGDVYALDPDAGGKLIWHTHVGAGSALGGIHWGMAVSDGVVYAPVADPDYPLPRYFPEPGLYALDVENGALLWKHRVERGCEINLFEYLAREALYPECSFFYGLSGAATVANDLVLVGGLDGKLRAMRRSDGQVVWQADTLRGFDTVNGVPAHGGAMDVAAPLAVDDMLYVQSGYSLFGQLPGNALIAYRLSAPALSGR